MTAQIISIPNGAKALIAAPAQPMPEDISRALGNMVAGFPQILEAHLPYCFVPALMEEPSQVLVIILQSITQLQDIAGPMSGRLLDIMPRERKILILPLEGVNPVVNSVRRVGCTIFTKY